MMEMQGNATEIDERNLLQLDALLSHGYGLSPQLVMRSKGLSIEAKALYGYLSSFAGAGDTAFPSTSRILEELDISKNRFYKIRKELISWGFISIETTATSAGLRTVYTLPQNPIAIKTEIDEIASRRNEIKSSLVANLHNEDTVSHKGDSESEHLQQSAGNEPCRQSEAKAQNRGSNLKPCLQSEDEGCLQSGDKLYIDTNINPKVSIDRSAAHPSDDEGPSDWKVTEGMTDPIDILCRRALEKYNGKLPTMVNFIFDEFANIGTIPDIEQTIAVTRSRNIGISIILQSVAQLESRYDKKAKTIIDCCDTTLFLGGKSNSTNKEISEMIGKQTINQKTFGETRGQSGSSSKNIQIQGRDLIDAAEIGKMNRREAILLIAGTNPLKDLKYPVEQHPNYIYLDPGRNKPGQVKNRCLYDEPFNILEYMDEIRTKDDTYAS